MTIKSFAHTPLFSKLLAITFGSSRKRDGTRFWLESRDQRQFRPPSPPAAQTLSKIVDVGWWETRILKGGAHRPHRHFFGENFCTPAQNDTPQSSCPHAQKKGASCLISCTLVWRTAECERRTFQHSPQAALTSGPPCPCRSTCPSPWTCPCGRRQRLPPCLWLWTCPCRRQALTLVESQVLLSHWPSVE